MAGGWRGFAALVSAVALVLAGCGAAGVTFDPTGPCLVDGRAPGTYPALESMLPTAVRESPPATVDSGRSCTATALGTLVDHDIHELHFAGATWDFGNGTGVTSAVFALPGASLPADWMAEFYRIGAITGKKTDNIETSQPTFQPIGETWRLDTLNDLSLQTVITWQDGAVARVVLVATAVLPDVQRSAHEQLVVDAVAATAAAMALVPGATTGPGPSR